MSYYDESYPFYYKKNNNYIAKSFRQINETLDLTEKEIKILSFFSILRIIDIILTYIYFQRRNAYYTMRFIDFIFLLISFIVSSCVYLNKDNVKQRATMLSIFFNFTFLCYDTICCMFYAIFRPGKIILLISLIVNEIYLIRVVILMYKIIQKFLKVLKSRKKNK